MRTWSLLMISAAIISLSGCNDPSSPLGGDFLPSDVEFHTITIPADAFEYQSGVAAVSNNSGLGGAAVLVGRSGDSVVAHGLVAITERYERLENLVESDVVSVRLHMRALNYLYGDAGSRLTTFDVVPIDGTLTLDTQWDPGLVSTIAAAPSLGSFQGSYPDTNSIDIQLDPAAAADYLRNYSADAGDGESQLKKYLVLRARDDATAVGSWLGVDFLGLEEAARPVLVVELRDTTLQIGIDVSSWITDTPAEAAPGHMLLAGGEPVRTWMRFSIDSIPGEAIIHKAEMTFHVDTANSIHGTSGKANYFVAYVANDSVAARANRAITGNVTVLEAFRQSEGEQLGDEFLISSLGRVITTWLRHRSGASTRTADANHGLILALNRNASVRAPLETATLDRLSLHAPDAADPSLRPMLTVTYSTQSDAK